MLPVSKEAALETTEQRAERTTLKNRDRVDDMND